MKKFIFLFAIAILFLNGTGAVSSTFKEAYAPRETMIGELTGGILAPIEREQIRVVRDGHLDVGVQYGTGKLGNRHFVWIVAPNTPGRYTIIIKDIVALVNGAPQIVEYKKDFFVQGAMADYSVVPGVIVTNSDFRVTINAYTNKEIKVDFPEQRTINLYPGTNYVDFSIGKVLGTQQIEIVIGMYKIPAYISGQKYVCGDGRIDDREVCDGDNLGGKDCTTVLGGFVSGQLRCMSGCLAFDTSQCNLPLPEPECGIERLDLCKNEMGCVGAGGYWYNNSCNKYGQGAVCDALHVELCKTAGTCLDAGGYWYNASCNKNPESVCGSANLDLCKTHGTCLDAGGYWYNNSCNRNPQSVCGDGILSFGEECDGMNFRVGSCVELGFDGGNLSCIAKECNFNVSQCFLILEKQISFSLDPAEIKSTVLIGSAFPTYKFKITNAGDSEIVGLRLDYDPMKFIISPSGEVNLSVNGSVDLNITIKEAWMGGAPFKGVVIAYIGEVHKFMILEINFTRNASNTRTSYSRGGTSGQAYYCSEISGVSCSAEQQCDGVIVETIDVKNCCVGKCLGRTEEKSSSWIGYLITGIVILVLVIVFVKYKKAGKSVGSPLASKVASIKKSLP